jgi:hypothetical protein
MPFLPTASLLRCKILGQGADAPPQSVGDLHSSSTNADALVMRVLAGFALFVRFVVLGRTATDAERVVFPDALLLRLDGGQETGGRARKVVIPTAAASAWPLATPAQTMVFLCLLHLGIRQGFRLLRGHSITSNTKVMKRI